MVTKEKSRRVEEKFTEKKLYIYEQDFVVNKLLGLIDHKTQLTNYNVLLKQLKFGIWFRKKIFLEKFVHVFNMIYNP